MKKHNQNFGTHLNFAGVMFASALFLMALFIGNVQAADSHAGYYYPEVKSTETYVTKVPPFPGISQLSRIAFVTQLDTIQMKRPYPPTYHMFAKGSAAQKLIIVSTGTGRYNTLYQMRGLLASMTADARVSPLFVNIGKAEQLNFLDLLAMVGFDQLTITNGDDVSHRFLIK